MFCQFCWPWLIFILNSLSRAEAWGLSIRVDGWFCLCCRWISNISSQQPGSSCKSLPSSNTFFFFSVYIRLENYKVDDIPGYNLHVQLQNISLLRNWEIWYIIYRVKEWDCLSWLIIDSEGIFWMLPIKINALVESDSTNACHICWIRLES